MYKNVHYYSLLDKHNGFANQSAIGDACSKITIILLRMVYFLYAENLSVELPGYGLVYVHAWLHSLRHNTKLMSNN